MAIFPIGAKVGADTSGFIGAMGGATRGLSAFTGAAGLGAVAIGVFAGAAGLGIAISAAREFQTEMIKLNTLVGIQADQVDEWSSALKRLAVETGRAPADLARAMFAITSGGARGVQAMELLEQSAKASAIGLGDMTAIGRTATAMLQAFGTRGLTTEKAIDVLTSTVREGNLEASSLAGAFSRVLGPAAALGASVEDVGAFMATFTRLGGSTEQAATGLLNTFNLLIKPPKDAREAMEELGIGIEGIRATIREKGLLAGLEEMAGALEGNVDALGKVVPNTRSLIAILNTVILQSEQYAITQDNVNNSLGLTSEAFETWSDSADAAFTRFGAGSKTAAIAVGEIFLPPVILLLDALTAVIGLLEKSAEGWGLIFGAVGDAGEEIKEFLALAAAVPVELEGANQSVAEFVSELEGIGRINLDNLQDLATFSIRTLQDQLESGKLTAEQREKAIGQLERERQRLAAVNLEIQRLIIAKEEEIAAEKLFEEERLKSLELTDEELDSIQSIVDALEDELDALTMTRAAILDKELADLRATDTTREAVAALLAEIQAQNDLAEAIKETERAKAKAARDEARRLLNLKRERERAAATEVRRREREEQARLNAEMQEAVEIAQEFANTIATAFEDVISGTKGVADAFGTMVTDILKQIQRLVIQRTIVEPLVDVLLSQFAPSGARVHGGPVTAGSSFLVGERGPELFRPGRSGNITPNGQLGGGAAIIIQQTINFSPSLIDGKSGQRFIEENAGTITGLVAEGAQRSAQLASAFQGQTG